MGLCYGFVVLAFLYVVMGCLLVWLLVSCFCFIFACSLLGVCFRVWGFA